MRMPADDPRTTARPHNGEPAAEFVELAPSELRGVFAAPAWLRDLGMMSWLLVGVAVLLVGLAALLSLTNAIVAPVVTAGIIAAVLSPLVARCSAAGCRGRPATAIVFLAVDRGRRGFAVLLLGGVVEPGRRARAGAQERRGQAPVRRCRTPA